MRKPLITIAILAGLLCLMPAWSHHSPASHYLIDELITVEGVVTRFRLINPHARIYFDVTAEDGTTEPWLAEGNASAILKRRGWTRETLQPGDPITISGNPARDGSNKLDWKTIVLADGTELRGGNTVASERDRILDDIEARRRKDDSSPD